MADPQHIPELDGFDRMTVGLYRLGLVVSVLGVGGLAGALVRSAPAGPWQLLTFVGVALTVPNLHLYAKHVRWVIHVAAWTGAVLTALVPMLHSEAAHWVGHAGLGFLFVVLSALALKERFCFRLPGLRLVPLFLAGSLVPMVLRIPHVAGWMLVPAAVLLLILAIAKLRMPLHFDVGDKSRYQV